MFKILTVSISKKSWVLGMFDIGTLNDLPVAGAFRLELCPNNLRDEEKLIPLI